MCKGTKKSKYICSHCFQLKEEDVFLCHTGTNRSYFYTLTTKICRASEEVFEHSTAQRGLNS